MKVLIGTPIHKSKDYCMERWLQNVAKLQTVYPADLLLVDNSSGLDYIKKVKGYCQKYQITDYQTKHLDFPPLQGPKKEIDEQIHERIARSRELIRQVFLASDYDAYFYWESDILIPTNALNKLVDLMKVGSFWVVVHNCWVNNIPNQVNFDYGIVLFNRAVLKKYSFIPNFGTDPDKATCWYDAEIWFRKRLLKDKCTYTDVLGVIEPVYHLSK